jgi:hypothetical protein
VGSVNTDLKQCLPLCVSQLSELYARGSISRSVGTSVMSCILLYRDFKFLQRWRFWVMTKCILVSGYTRSATLVTTTRLYGVISHKVIIEIVQLFCYLVCLCKVAAALIFFSYSLHLLNIFQTTKFCS